MARSVECECKSNFTCGYCLRNAKPWHYTFANGSASYELPAAFCQPSEALRERHRAEQIRAANEESNA